MKKRSVLEDYMAILESRINREYSAKWKQIEKKVQKYLVKTEKKYSEQKKKLEDNLISKEEFTLWYKSLFETDKEWERIRDDIAKLMTSADDKSATLINDMSPRVFLKTFRDSIYDTKSKELEKIIKDNDAKQVMKRLSNIPYRVNSVNRKKALAWNRRRIDKAVIQASARRIEPRKILDDIQGVVRSNMAAAVRNARTTVSSANNSAKQTLCDIASKFGVEIYKEWVSVMDDRTRGTHIFLDGMRVKSDEKFITINGNELSFPCDPAAPPEEVFNCRCTMKVGTAVIGKNKTMKVAE